MARTAQRERVFGPCGGGPRDEVIVLQSRVVWLEIYKGLGAFRTSCWMGRGRTSPALECVP